MICGYRRLASASVEIFCYFLILSNNRPIRQAASGRTLKVACEARRSAVFYRRLHNKIVTTSHPASCELQ